MVDQGQSPSAESGWPHVVIIGGGFAGLSCARSLGKRQARVTLIDRRNYHLFVPLLYQVATAALSPADIAQPIRRVLARYPNIDVVMGEVTGIDTAARQVQLDDAPPLPYDVLVVASGSDYSYFGHDDWRAFAPGVKTIDNARDIRARILRGFELAEIEPDPVRQRVLTTTVIVGGGPTGVEMAGAVSELVRDALAKDFRHIDPRNAVTYLIEAGPRLLTAFPEPLASYAARELDKLGVTVRTNTAVKAIGEGRVDLEHETIEAHTIVWGAGVKASSAHDWLGVTPDRAGRVPVAPDLSVPGLPDVYVLGDTAVLNGDDGKPLPGLAQVAQQQGYHLGRALARRFEKGEAVPPFRFKNRGNTAVIGRHAAVFDFGKRTMKGRLAWLLWAIIHVYLLIGFEKRFLVASQWLVRYITRARGVRLIS